MISLSDDMRKTALMLGFIDIEGCWEIDGISVGEVDGNSVGEKLSVGSELTDGSIVGASLGEGDGAGDSVGKLE
jgi:hypothetical protein